MTNNPYEAPRHYAEEPEEATQTPDQHKQLLIQIKRSANMSVVFGVLGLLGGFPALMALSFAGAAEKLIKKHNVGSEYLVQVKLGRTLGRIGLTLLFLFLLAISTFIGLFIYFAD